MSKAEPDLYPLRFVPILRRYIWGGRRLGTVLGKQLGEGDDYAESWEVVDHGQDQSVVQFGPLEGHSLAQLVSLRGRELLGRHHPQTCFPLLFKFLDAQRNLSVQVHPNDQQAAQLTPPDLGKTEAWVVLAAEPGSVLYAGLKRGFDRAALEREMSRGTTQLCLHKIEPTAGDCIFVPAGTIHALGEGLLVAEIQQASDTTYRLFDWNRVGADGQPRELHMEAGLDVIDYDRGPIEPRQGTVTGRRGVERLVECEKFVLDRCTTAESHTVGGDDRFHILAVIAGQMEVGGDPSKQALATGQTVLIPVSHGPVNLRPAAEVVYLDMYLP